MICDAGQSLQCANLELSLGLAVGEHASLPESIALIKDALRIKQEKLPANDPTLVDLLIELAGRTGEAGDATQAQDLYRKALEVAQAFGRPTPQLALALDGFARGALPYNDPRRLEYEERSAQLNEQFYGRNSF